MGVISHGEAKYSSAGKMLASSSVRNWPGVILEKWEHESARLPTIVPQSTEISIQLRGASTVERESNGEYQKVSAKPGTIWLCPAGIKEDYVHVKGRLECLHIYLPQVTISDEKMRDTPIGYHTISNDRFIQSIGDMALNILEKETSAGRILAESMAFTLSAYLCEKYSGTSKKPSTTGIRPLEKRRLAQVCNFIEQNVTKPIGIEDLANVACQSVSHFSRTFKAALGISPAEYVSRERLHVAKAMLRKENLQIGEISRLLGFSSQTNFSRSFRCVSGMTPLQYRAQSKNLVTGADFSALT